MYEVSWRHCSRRAALEEGVGLVWCRRGAGWILLIWKMSRNWQLARWYRSTHAVAETFNCGIRFNESSIIKNGHACEKHDLYSDHPITMHTDRSSLNSPVILRYIVTHCAPPPWITVGLLAFQIMFACSKNIRQIGSLLYHWVQRHTYERFWNKYKIVFHLAV